MRQAKALYFNEIRVQNFKNLKDARLRLGDVSLLVGCNNSGKSNFLGVIQVLRSLLFGGQDGKKFVMSEDAPWLEKKAPTSIEVSYSVFPKGEQVDATYSLEFLVSNEKLEIKKEFIFFKSTSTTGPQRRLFEREGTKFDLRVGDKGNFKEYSVAVDASVFEILPSIIAGDEPEFGEVELLSNPIRDLANSAIFKTHDLSSNYISEVQGTLPVLVEMEEKKDPRFKQFKEAFCEILGLKNLVIEKYNPPNMKDKSYYFGIVYEAFKKESMFIQQMSDGTRALFLLLYHFFVSPTPVVFVDEPEIGLHPNAIAKLVELLNKGGISKQIVMSTHSAFLLNLVNPKDVTLSELDENGMASFVPVSSIPDLNKRLKSKFVSFGDLFADNFRRPSDTSL